MQVRTTTERAAVGPFAEVKRRRRRRQPPSPKPMSRNRQELHRMVREAMEKGFGTHYGAYVATLPRPEPPSLEEPDREMESFLGEEDEEL